MNSRELSTLALALGMITQGDVANAGDVSASRWRAVEALAAHGHWGQAQWTELIPSSEAGLLSPGEANTVAKGELYHHKLGDDSHAAAELF